MRQLLFPRYECPVPFKAYADRGVVAGIDELDVLDPAPMEVQAMGTEFERPRSALIDVQASRKLPFTDAHHDVSLGMKP